MRFTDCYTVADWIEYYTDATRNELKNAYEVMEGKYLDEVEQNRLQAVKTLLDERNDNRYYD